MLKDIYLEEKVFIMANQRKGAFLKRKIYQEFLQDSVTPGFVPGDDVSLRTMETALGLSAGPLPVDTRQPLTNGLQLPVEVVIKIVNHFTLIWHHMVPPGIISLL